MRAKRRRQRESGEVQEAKGKRRRAGGPRGHVGEGQEGQGKEAKGRG
jgi:hypothetical protein